MANDERDASHIWLRQSVRFTVGDRERTIEIALPLPVGATPQVVERLLAEADAGMARLGQHLDQQVAAALGDGDGAAPATPLAAPAVAAPAAPLAAPAAATPGPAVPAPAAPAPAARVPTYAPAPTPTRAPAPPTPIRTPAVPTPAQSTTAPAPSHASAVPPAGRIAEAPAPARPAPATPPPPTPPSPAPAASASARAPLSPQGEGQGGEVTLARPEFLAETRALGLTPPQAMERLGVRSLDGLNLREALEMLRRQLGSGAPAAPEPSTPRTTPAAANGASARAAAPAPAMPAAPVVFDEEEEFDLVVLGPDPQAEDYGDELPYGDDAAPDPAGALDALDDDDGALGDDEALDEVPDLGAMLPTPLAPQPDKPASGGAFTPARKARARELVAGFRAVAAGGAAIRSQHTAFANVVADQLTAETAATLVRGLWGQPPERLGADQLDAVIRWGKQDEFAEEAPVVLALLRAEQRQHASATDAPAPAASDDASPTPPARPTRAARKPASGGEQP